MFEKYYNVEEKDGHVRTQYFKKIEVSEIDKKLLDLEKNFQSDDLYLDIYFYEKTKNNFDFYLNTLIDGMYTYNYLEKWINLDLNNIYNYILYDNKYCNDIVEINKGYLIFKLKYTNNTSIITSYIKVNCRNVKWENTKKVWYIPLFYIFELSKLTLFLGGTVSDTVLYQLCKLFQFFSSVQNVNKTQDNTDYINNINSNTTNYENGTNSDNIQNNAEEEQRKTNMLCLKNISDNPSGKCVSDNPSGKCVSDNLSGKCVSDNPSGKCVSDNLGTKFITDKSHAQLTKEEEAYNLETFIKKKKSLFVEYIKNVKMFKLEHIIISNTIKSDILHIKILPYNEEVIKKTKEMNIFQWDKVENIWIVKKMFFKIFYLNIIKFFDYKICSHYDYYKMMKQKLIDKEYVNSNKYYSDFGNNNLSNLTTNMKLKINSEKRKYDQYLTNTSSNNLFNQTNVTKKKKSSKDNLSYDSTDSSYSDELSNHVDSSYYEGRESVNKIKITASCKSYYKDLLYNKLKKIKKLQPPNYTYDPKGSITKRGAGTQGFEVFDLPAHISEWNKISFCIVPDENKNIDLYDPKILCSLVSDVYLLKEKAIDIILKKYSKWPEYNDIFWNTLCSENEFIIGNKDFNTRQKLAHDRLFHKQYFYIFNIKDIKEQNYHDPIFLCETLITLGAGKIIKNPLNAEYIIVNDSNSRCASDFYNSLMEKSKNKNKKKLPLFVKPKFIYDCILNYAISYPSKHKNHFAFA
ncbi:conserved protein, unknown function [Hepatocystis sp. ex Piliocolobus tephrosceles]|nr:conserved protein, unknown function [Hepatocystis sp. ex Piliocolobus tephrosceles]